MTTTHIIGWVLIFTPTIVANLIAWFGTFSFESDRATARATAFVALAFEMAAAGIVCLFS